MCPSQPVLPAGELKIATLVTMDPSVRIRVHLGSAKKQDSISIPTKSGKMEIEDVVDFGEKKREGVLEDTTQGNNSFFPALPPHSVSTNL